MISQHAARIFGVLCLVETSVMGDPRLCTFEINGETKYYVCPRGEQCCNVGCCLSPSFQFYQLWYYWLMVIFIMVVCSGGQWWYKYWVGGGGDVASRSNGVGLHSCTISAPPPCPGSGVGTGGVLSSTRPPHLVTAAASSGTPTGSTPAPSSFTLIHQICKPHHYHSRGEGKVLSPYEQIYGPPPSYESVIGAHPSSMPASYPPGAEYTAGTSSQNYEGTTRGGHGAEGISLNFPRGDCPSYAQSVLDEGAHNVTTERPEQQQQMPTTHRRSTSCRSAHLTVSLPPLPSHAAEPSPSHSSHSVADSTASASHSESGTAVSHSRSTTSHTWANNTQSSEPHLSSPCLDHNESH